MNALLDSKNIIIYGAGGALGSAIARTFAREGASLYLTGRTREPLDALAGQITAAGGKAAVAVVDALDETAVREHADAVAAEAGSIDVSFNLIKRGDVHGIAFLDMTLEDFVAPVINGVTSTFITARAAARHMVQQGSGVILSLTSGSARGQGPMMGGTGAADAATEQFLRSLAAEVGASGVRVTGIWTAGVYETFPEEEGSGGLTRDALDGMLGPMTMLKHVPRIAHVADTAAFLASDGAAGITGSTVNVTCGLVAG
jgi:NAD(P)-dependent dehydrogenase (short-subunit alcohol dehydrogenase family)